MKRPLPLILLLCALAAGCGGGVGGGGGGGVNDTFAQDQTAACAKVQQRLAAIKRPVVTKKPSKSVRKRESKA